MEIYSNVWQAVSTSIIVEWCDGCPLCVIYVHSICPSSTVPGQGGLRTSPTYTIRSELLHRDWIVPDVFCFLDELPFFLILNETYITSVCHLTHTCLTPTLTCCCHTITANPAPFTRVCTWILCRISQLVTGGGGIWILRLIRKPVNQPLDNRELPVCKWFILIICSSENKPVLLEIKFQWPLVC
jgi:hypothetical protein